jgi:hypothetical protein
MIADLRIKIGGRHDGDVAAAAINEKRKGQAIWQT